MRLENEFGHDPLLIVISPKVSPHYERMAYEIIHSSLQLESIQLTAKETTPYLVFLTHSQSKPQIIIL